jgi:dolichyl-phosphate beta-glucosyltransferase
LVSFTARHTFAGTKLLLLMQSLTIIIPCYNEESRLDPYSFSGFANLHPDIRFIFINDGSTDGTSKILEQIHSLIGSSEIISFSENRGKAEAVRTGLISALKTNPDYIGYLDADLSTTLKEFYEMWETAKSNDLDMVLASRIKKIDTKIERSFFRHFTGRILATIIDQKFDLGVYDTQCGAKIFKSDLIEKIIKAPFSTKWFFDVEILLRMRSLYPEAKATEIPLKQWINVSNSKIGIWSFPAVVKDLFSLFNKY